MGLGECKYFNKKRLMVLPIDGILVSFQRVRDLTRAHHVTGHGVGHVVVGGHGGCDVRVVHVHVGRVVGSRGR